MTLHILSIDADPPTQRFWTSAGDLLSSLVSVQPTYAQAIHAVIAEGGDVEITAHNEPDRITVTLVESSGLRCVVFDNSEQAVAHQKGRVNQARSTPWCMGYSASGATLNPARRLARLTLA